MSPVALQPVQTGQPVLLLRPAEPVGVRAASFFYELMPLRHDRLRTGLRHRLQLLRRIGQRRRRLRLRRRAHPGQLGQPRRALHQHRRHGADPRDVPPAPRPLRRQDRRRLLRRHPRLWQHLERHAGQRAQHGVSAVRVGDAERAERRERRADAHGRRVEFRGEQGGAPV
jgi:hypothetical protein